MTSDGKPFISVVIPAHNEERYIHRCLTALCNQTLPRTEYELIVVDNNSTDRTKEIIQSHPHATYLFQLKGPVGSVRNTGVSNAKGEIIVFIDADCICSPTWLEKCRVKLSKESNLAFGGRYLLDRNANWIERFWLLEAKNNFIIGGDLLGGCICLWKKDFEHVGGFRVDITSGEDTELTNDLRLFGITVKIDDDFSVVHLGNAKTISGFVKRQVWHSENYIPKFYNSIKDPTFILICLWMTSISLLAANLIFGSYFLAFTALFAALSIPFVFTLKRIVRSNLKLKLALFLPAIYFIDFLYIIGRSGGVLKGIRFLIYKLMR